MFHKSAAKRLATHSNEDEREKSEFTSLGEFKGTSV